MSRLILAAVVTVVAGATSAWAQPPAPRPLGNVGMAPVSPYMNLLRPGTNPAVNYYGIVRPEMAFQNAISGIQGQLWQTQQALNQQANAGDTTGHPVAFLNHGSFFMTTGNSSRAGGPAAPARAALGGGFGSTPPRAASR
jgi:hypothetical protein